MRSFAILSSSLVGFVSAGQVNFYFDQNCQDYAGSVNVPSFTISGTRWIPLCHVDFERSSSVLRHLWGADHLCRFKLQHAPCCKPVAGC
ncbi:hypothetical protein QBC34DRAFT_153367 [Podospora aff. communis PSN243]|uniref:Uncharacterized protein n=1 Tax=Podospora aff. communis PSN243 TaxID=3040156 RepID=A0AAV9GFT3_9PEZI|nr:hypothetical protein QBC34DRAFT_153367 [Podospora aff. communis PSN243]